MSQVADVDISLHTTSSSFLQSHQYGIGPVITVSFCSTLNFLDSGHCIYTSFSVGTYFAHFCTHKLWDLGSRKTMINEEE